MVALNSFNSFNSCSKTREPTYISPHPSYIILAPMGAPVPTPRTSRSRRWCGCRALPVPRCPYTGCRSRFHHRWNTMPSPDDPCGCSPDSTFRVPRKSGDGYNAGGLLAHWILPAEFHVLLIGEVVEPLAPPIPVIILNALRAFALDCRHILLSFVTL